MTLVYCFYARLNETREVRTPGIRSISTCTDRRQQVWNRNQITAFQDIWPASKTDLCKSRFYDWVKFAYAHAHIVVSLISTRVLCALYSLRRLYYADVINVFDKEFEHARAPLGRLSVQRFTLHNFIMIFDLL